MNTHADISAIRKHLLDKAEKIYWASFSIILFFNVLLIVGHFIKIEKVMLIIGFVSLLVPLATTFLRYWAADVASKGDKCRRLILYADGLGENIPQDELRMCNSWVLGHQPADTFITPYYGSSLAPGPERLIDITKESVYFTASLADKTAGYLTWVLITSGIIIVALIYFSFSLPEGIVTVNSLVLIVAGILLGAEILLLKLNYSRLANLAWNTYERCSMLAREHVTNSDNPLYAAINVIEDYHLLIITAPPVPSLLYKKYMDELNTAYSADSAEKNQ